MDPPNTNNNSDCESHSREISGDPDIAGLSLQIKRPIPKEPQNPSNTNLPLKTEDELNQLKLTLPKEIWFNCYPMYLYQDFWCINLVPTIAFQTHFQAQPTDIFITSLRKTGTTWLKALVFSLFDRAIHPLSMSPLLTLNPHELIPQLESNIYAKSKCPLLKNDTSPRIFGTHLPYPSLPNSIKESNCKIIYICRNPLDTFISSWLFYLNYNENKTIGADMMGEYLEKFLEGKFPFGPFEDHVLGYWEQRIAHSEKVFFVKYEDLKANPKDQLKLLAEFLRCPFSREEEEDLGVVDGIIKLCDIKKLKEVEANKSGRVYHQIENKWFFRKGEVGDWVNYLSPFMAKRIEKNIDDKLAGSGLTL